MAFTTPSVYDQIGGPGSGGAKGYSVSNQRSSGGTRYEDWQMPYMESALQNANNRLAATPPPGGVGAYK